MSPTTVVVPYGSGIGDLVNMRPLLSAIVAARPNHDVQCVALPHLEWLLPAGVRRYDGNAGAFMWQRASRNHLLAPVTRRLDARVANPALTKLPGALARGLTLFLRCQGAAEVINFLGWLVEEGVSDRWVHGPWNPERAHVVDLMADRLSDYGVPLSVGSRVPRLTTSPHALPGAPSVVLNPNAGNTLKEPGVPFWREIIVGLRASGIAPVVLDAPASVHARTLAQFHPDLPLLTGTLEEIAGHLATVDVLVSPDTGILHLAAALRTPFVGVFGPTDPVFLGPYPGSTGTLLESTVTHQPVCQGCWAPQILPESACALRGLRSCVDGISAQAVIDAVMQLLSTASDTTAAPRA